MKHGVIVGGTGAGKSTFLENIIAQDLTRRFGARRMPMIIFDGKGEREFLDRLLPHIEAAGRLQDLRVIDPTHPTESARYNPFYALDDAYQEHVNFIFRSFGLREDFFKGHQEAYLSDLVRILQYTGKLFNVYDVLVMALDEKVLAGTDRSCEGPSRLGARHFHAEAIELRDVGEDAATVIRGPRACREDSGASE